MEAEEEKWKESQDQKKEKKEEKNQMNQKKMMTTGEPSWTTNITAPQPQETTIFTTSDIKVEEEPFVTPIAESEEIAPEIALEEVALEFDIEDSKLLCQSVWSIPAVIWGDHLSLKPEDTDKFAVAFHRYCIKKGINPLDYFFDEFPLILAGIGIVRTLKTQYTEHKAQKKKDEKRAKEEEAVESRVSTPRPPEKMMEEIKEE